MSDLKRSIDEIRFFLLSDQERGDARVREAAQRYLEARKQVNERLRQCESCLRQKLFSEAVHLAETEPRLLEQYALLEILDNLEPEDRERWQAYLVQERLERPAVLLGQVALDLNRAYLHVQPLEEILRRHRILSWAKAPLKDRLPVIRELARLSPNNQLYADDVRTFERERLKLLEEEVGSAIAQANAETVQELLTEVDGTAWVTPPPANLRLKLQQSAHTLGRAQLVPRLENELLQAWAATDANRVRQLRDELGRHIGPPDNGDPVWKRLHQALHWLKAEEAFQEGITKLKALMDANAPEQELNRWYDYLHEFGTPLPPWLEQEFDEKLASKSSSSFDRTTLVIVLVIVLFVIVGIAILTLYLSR